MSKKRNKKKKTSGAFQWAPYTFNIYSGCENNCSYCYGKSMAVRFKRKTTADWCVPVLNEDALARSSQKKNGRIMFPSAHDITPITLNNCLVAMDNLLKAGNELLVVSRPRIDCIKAVCKKFGWAKDQITFRFSIGSVDDKVLNFWESSASCFQERIECLEHAHKCGYKTGVSLEPMLDAHADMVIAAVKQYVSDEIWIGLPKMLKSRLSVNGHKSAVYMDGADKLLKSLSNQYINDLYRRFKADPQIKWKDSIMKIVGTTTQKVVGPPLKVK